MKGRRFWVWWIAGVLVGAAALILQRVPGYMDAEYYTLGGLRLAAGGGWQEMVVWNYLNDPTGLPQPAFAYWMPLPALLAALGALIRPTFLAARIPFLLLAGLIPPVSSVLAEQLSGSRSVGLLAAALALCSGFYAQYTSLPETFTPYMLLGTAFLWTAALQKRWQGARQAALLGLVAGLMHLTRADGLLWLAAALAWIAWKGLRRLENWRIVAGVLLAVGGAYLLVMGAWYARNLAVFGALMPPGSSRAMWILTYEETFAYPAAVLTPARWLAAPLSAHLTAWGGALKANLGTLLGVQGMVVLLPLMGLGAWKLRRSPAVPFGLTMLAVTFGVMTVVFPFSGGRGGYFHSGSAVQPLLWALAAAGFADLIHRAAQRRGWQAERAGRMFGAALVVLLAVLTAGLFWLTVVGMQPEQPQWEASTRAAQQAEEQLVELGARAQDVVLINNPVGYSLAAGRAAVVIPDGGPETILAAAQQFGARYLILEVQAVSGMWETYLHPQDAPGLEYLGSAGEAKIFQIKGVTTP